MTSLGALLHISNAWGLQRELHETKANNAGNQEPKMLSRFKDTYYRLMLRRITRPQNVLN